MSVCTPRCACVFVCLRLCVHINTRTIKNTRKANTHIYAYTISCEYYIYIYIHIMCPGSPMEWVGALLDFRLPGGRWLDQLLSTECGGERLLGQPSCRTKEMAPTLIPPAIVRDIRAPGENRPHKEGILPFSEKRDLIGSLKIAVEDTLYILRGSQPDYLFCEMKSSKGDSFSFMARLNHNLTFTCWDFQPQINQQVYA